MEKFFTSCFRAKYALMVTLLIALLASCSKKNDPVPDVKPPTETPATKSNAKDITALSILKSENAAITGDGFYYKTGTKIYITIPLNSSLTNIKTTFTISAKATITINGTVLSNNTANLDLTNTLSATVTAEDGTSTNFTIMTQLGIKEIDAMIYPFIEKYNIPAASYAIAKNSEEAIVYKNAAGFANVENQERVKPNYIFRLASMSKQHTAIAIMKLIQEGKIGIDELVFGLSGILKASFPTVGPMSAKVTVRHLLEHTAGYTGDPMFNGVSGQTLDQKIQLMLNSAQSEPGTKFTYYNMGYGTLGKIIEVVSGKEYGEYLKEIYSPAGVADLSLSAQSVTSRKPNEATCYPQGTSTAYGSNVDVIKAAAGVAVNTEDLFKILYAVDGNTKRPDILNSNTKNLMFTPSTVFSGYAKGWRTNHSLFKGFYHGGNVIGTATFWIYGEEYSAAILLNSRNNDDAFDTDLIVLTNNVMKKAKELNL